MRRLFVAAFLVVPIFAVTQDPAPQPPIGNAVQHAVSTSRLEQPGTAPFHLKATIQPPHAYNADHKAEIEEFWASPTKWRRTIRSSEFEQTVIVNGAARYEKNSSDYCPSWITDVVSALFELVPDGSLAELKQSDLTIALHPNQGISVPYHPTGTDGKVSMSWGGSIEFDDSGLLRHISSTAFTANFERYRKFHDRDVPYTIETFPHEASGDLVTSVSELEDLRPEDNLFEVPELTPNRQQIRTTQLPEIEYRKLAIDPQEVKWPSVKVRPTTGNLVASIVTDRAGTIRECRMIISHNMSLRDSACEVIKAWHFKPYEIDGIPAQVASTLTFTFNSAMEGDQSKFEAASFYFKRSRDLSFLRTEGAKPFHLVATFQGYGVFGGLQGTYEETWFAPHRWLRKVTIGNKSVAESDIDEDHYVQRADTKFDPVINRIFALYAADYPGYAYYSPDTDWNMGDESFEGAPVLRVGMGHMAADGKVDYTGRAYYFDKKGILQARTNGSDTVAYSEFVEFAGKQVPRTIELRTSRTPSIAAHIDLLEEATPVDDDFFVIRGIKHGEVGRPLF